MKKISILFAAASIIFMGCGKENETTNTISTAMFINAAPGITTHNVIVDDISQTATALVYRAASPYLNLAVGSRKIKIRSNNLALPVDYISFPNENFENNRASTFIIYDTLTSLNGTLKSIRLSDTLTPAPDGTIRVRFIPAAVNAPTSDITFLRINIMPNDSVTITNQNYIGSSPSNTQIALLSRYFQIPGGNYIIKQKAAGTQTILASTPDPRIVPTPAGSFITSIAGIFKGNFTVYSTGGARGLPLSIGFARQFP